MESCYHHQLPQPQWQISSSPFTNFTVFDYFMKNHHPLLMEILRYLPLYQQARFILFVNKQMIKSFITRGINYWDFLLKNCFSPNGNFHFLEILDPILER